MRPVEEWRKSFNENGKLEYLDYKKEKRIFLNEISPRNIKEENNILCKFASSKKEVGRQFRTFKIFYACFRKNANGN